MNRFKIIILLSLFSFVSASTVVGSWLFDTEASVRMEKKFAQLFSRLEGMQIKFAADGNYTIVNKGGGTWSKKGDRYLLKAKSGKKMSAQLHKDGLLEIVQPTSRGDIKLFFHKGKLKAGSVANYIYINRVYKQHDRIYDNGYLYYLFLDNNRFYSYASPKKSITVNEIKAKGDKLRYIFLGNKIVMRGPFKVVIRAYNKSKIVTSQKDTLYLEK